MRWFKTTLSFLAVGATVGFIPASATSSIVGGRSISITKAPWQLWIGNCGAVWVGGRNVLTAQHCIDDQTAGNTYVWAGITRRSQAVTSNRIAVTQIIKKTPNTDLSQDIAILKLAADITSSLAQPIRFVMPADVTAGLTNRGVVCAASGWGKLSPSLGLSDSLQWVESKIYNTPTNPSGVIKWAGQGGTVDIGSCQGDSGGPLVVRDATGTGWLVAGLSSYIESECGDPDSPSSYSRISAFTTWLAQNGVNPLPTPVQDHRITTNSQGFSWLGARRFALNEARNLEWMLTDLSGSTVRRNHGHFAAGAHSLPVEGLSNGAYILRIQGNQIRAQTRIRIAD